MADIARIENGVVVQVWRDATVQVVPPTEGQPWTGLNPASYDGQLVEFDPDLAVTCDMLWDGEGLSLPLRSITASDVQNERARRLALGFNYDFGDARGVHHIGTTDADMEGWREVTDSAQAAVALGEGNLPLTEIVTNSGPAEVTAMEWMEILKAARLARQPIWAASFALQLMDPIPADYADDAYWD